jgi:hypothetical protein
VSDVISVSFNAFWVGAGTRSVFFLLIFRVTVAFIGTFATVFAAAIFRAVLAIFVLCARLVVLVLILLIFHNISLLIYETE